MRNVAKDVGKQLDIAALFRFAVFLQRLAIAERLFVFTQCKISQDDVVANTEQPRLVDLEIVFFQTFFNMRDEFSRLFGQPLIEVLQLL